MKSSDVITLSEEGFISRGNHRACYHYPGRPDKCIKVILSEDGKRICAFEFKYIKILYGRGFDPKTIPHYYGTVPVNIGVDHVGYVYDIVENGDKSQAKCLHDFFVDEELFHKNEEKLLELMEKLRQDLYDNQVIFRSLTTPNILFPVDSQGEMDVKLINDLGTRAVLKFNYHFGWAAHRYVNKYWAKFKRDIPKHYNQPWVLEFAKKI